jgi:hypothetical protein
MTDTLTLARAKEFRQVTAGLIVRRVVRTPAEWVKLAEKLAKGNKGVLQNTKWLQENGYSGLDQCMRKFPKLFKHIPQLKLDTHGRAA